MPEWSPSRREFLGITGVGGSSAVGFPVASWGSVTDVVPDRPFVPTAEEHWSLDLGDSAYVTGPVDGTLYARTPGVVHAIATDGTHRWQFEVESGYPGMEVSLESGYSFLGRTVYVDDDDQVYALDPEDGSVRWRYEDARRPSVRAALPGLVVVFDDRPLGFDDQPLALSAADGSERWRLELDGSAWRTPHLDGETLYVGTDNGTFYALDAQAGDVRWRVEPLADEDGSSESPRLMAVDSTANLVFARSDTGTLIALETDDGRERWRLETVSERYDFSPVVREDTVFVRDQSSLRALSTVDGRERWRFETESVPSWPRVVGETVYVGNEDALWALSVEDGRERWQFGTGAFPGGIVDDVLVTYTPEFTVYGLSSDDGRVRWKYDLGEAPAHPPAVHEDVVHFGTREGTVVALSDSGPTPVSDALRTVVSPMGLAVGGLLGGALAAGAYRRRSGAAGAGDADESETGRDAPTSFEDFELVESIAVADHVEVHEARAPDGTRVALKRLRDGELAPEVFEKFVETWAGLDVPGVLDVREWGTDPVPWVATEYATGGNLGAKAEHLTVEERVRVVAEAAETVHRAHREGVTHGRLVPGNVLFSADGVRVGDWRLAAELRDPPDGYRPPESDSDDSEGDGASPETTDAYQLAAMADELLADEHDSEEIADVLSRSLADDPGDRYDSALKLADALRWAVRE